MWIGGVRVILFDDEGKLLMVKQSHEGKDIWMVPGGGIEEGEDAAQCAIREVDEETGLKIKVKDLIWHVEEVSPKRGQRFVNFFTGEILSGIAELGHDPEFDKNGQVLRALKFVSQDEMKSFERVYPAFLREEVWALARGGKAEGPVFRLRQPDATG